MTTFCPKHNCPMVRIGEREVCLLAYAEGLVGKAVVDLAVDDGLTVLILQGNAPLPPENLRLHSPSFTLSRIRLPASVSSVLS